MTAERIDSQLMSVEDYLAWEDLQLERHEYIGGIIYAMAGGTTAHAALAMNVGIALGSCLRGKRCRPYGSDLRVRIEYPTHTRFYYPDLTVTCTQSPSQAVYHDEPAVIVEVISASTRRTDELEKRDAYQTIPTLHVYILLDQEKPEAVVWRRGAEGFVREVHSGFEATIELPEIEARLPLAEVYEAVLPRA